MKPKLEAILERYPNIKGNYIDVDKHHKIAADYNIFTIPAILVYVDGKETIREARYMSMKDLENKIDRYYGLLFE